MPLERIQTDEAPAAIGPYSQAVRAGEWVFVSGQVAIDPATGRLREGGFEDEARQALANLRAVLRGAGLGLEHLVRVTLYLTDLSLFPELNRIYGEVLGDSRPARVTVGVAALPLGARLEVEALATGG